MQPVELLSHATTRIEGTKLNGQGITGSGFFFTLCEQPDGSSVPVLFTNRHVVRDTVSTRFMLTREDADGNPANTARMIVQGPGETGGWHFHPNPDVDLCCLPMGDILVRARNQGQPIFVRPLVKMLLPDDDLLEGLDGAEDVLMVGYPNGIWDAHHNQPLIRKGITATHPKRDYNNKPEFLIDCACFPGSSGSPVVLYNRGIFNTPNGPATGNRLKLLGVLYAGPQHTTEGDIVIVNIPTAQVPRAVGSIPNHLGFVLKSRLLLDFEQYFPISPIS